MSWLATFGSDVKRVFSWLGSPKAQAIISAGEAVIEIADPALDGIIGLSNTWLQEIFKAQALATAASAGITSGIQKSAMVLNTLTPQVIAFAEAQKLPIPDATQIQNANNALVAFLNAFSITSQASVSTSSNTNSAASLAAAAAVGGV